MSTAPTTSRLDRAVALPSPSRALVALLLALFALGTGPLRAAELNVAAAADLKFALDALLADFARTHPAVTVKVAYGSSGNFHAQIQNGAPYDLYLSADIAYPRKLAEAGLALDGDVFLYAIGRLAVWVPKNSRLDVAELKLRALIAPESRRVAIANPRHAPYGVAALAAIESAGLLDQVRPRLVLGENVAQTAQFVQTGAADIGVIALSLALAPRLRESGRHWEIPLDAFPRMDQGGMILRAARHPEQARALRDHLLGPDGRELLKNSGFHLPER